MKLKWISLYVGILARISSVIGLISRIFYKSNYSIIAIFAVFLFMLYYNKRI